MYSFSYLEPACCSMSSSNCCFLTCIQICDLWHLGPSSQSYGFSSGHVGMWELDCEEGWALKNWCFELEWWRRLLRVPWTARSSNQSILKEINPGYSLEGLMLKFQYFGHLMQRANSLERHWCWERLRLGGEGAMEHEMVGWHHRLKGHEFKQTSGDSEA